MDNSPDYGDRAGVDFPVVGLGASAGGLEVYRKLLDALPADTGMAYVLIQHLDPERDSMMVDLLAGHTRMAVRQAIDQTPIERGHVYVMPPAAYLSIREGALRLSSPPARPGGRMPFDFFLRSLAEECGPRAICVILSGNGADGSVGLRAVKERGGLVIVQEPTEAAYDGMPRKAIATGAADLVLPLSGIPGAIARYGQQINLQAERRRLAPGGAVAGRLGEIIDVLQAKTAQKFELYKEGTLLRRIERRMAIAAAKDIDGYLEMLRRDSGELELLARDLLINVTHFFRDESAFAALAEKIVPELVRRQPPDQPLRIWVPACSTGEETYSIVMLFIEATAAAKRSIKLQVFASDPDPEAVAFARQGRYPAAIAADVPPARLARFFVQEEHGYRVVRELREAVVFTVQDLLTDAPFSRLEMISCRNLLIYLQPAVQEKILALFHFALSEGGVLFLGSSETVGSLADRFTPIDKQQRIYRRVGRYRPGDASFPIGANEGPRALGPRVARQRAAQRTGLGELSQQLLLEAYAPTSVLTNRLGEALHFFGQNDRYLRLAPGEASRDLLAMAREGLRPALRAAIRRAVNEKSRIVVGGGHVRRNGGSTPVSIAVHPLQSNGEELLLVSFIEAPAVEPPLAAETEASAAAATRTGQLEQELDLTRKELQDTVRDLEASNEELKAINEEAMSVNEEFQSTNEELETSKEELQSLNDELTAVNVQLHDTIEQQRATSNDLHNILNSSDLATLFLDSALNIRFFTSAAKSLLRIIPSDVGRPFGDLRHQFRDADLLADARAVLANPAPLRREIEAEDGRCYLERVLPYRTHDDRVEGVVFTFSDISEIKAAQGEIQQARSYSESIIDTIRQPLVVLDDHFAVISANRSFHRALTVEPEQAVGRTLAEIGDRCLDVPEVHRFLDLLRQGDAAIEDYEIDVALPLLGKRSLLLNARNIREGQSAARKVLVAIEDVTERKRADDALATAKLQAERANLGKSRFLAAASHDLRQPLQTLSLVQGILARKIKDPENLKLVARLDETLGAVSGMLNTLLDINQLEAGIVRPELIDFPIDEMFDRLRAEFAYHAQANGLGWRVMRCRLWIRSDPRLLEQMIRNLLSNAVKYTKRGRILVGCRRRGGKLRIEVCDTGIGIPDGQLDAIFEEFHQLDNPARERSRGLGLGLAIVQRLGTLLRHDMDVRSRPGVGSIFAVEVPLGRHDTVPSPEASRQLATAPGRPSAILVVEDDPTVREMLDILLTEEGHRTAVAADGREALAIVARGAMRPDLIVADYNLPGGITGLELVVELRKTLGRSIPAVILTGDISTATLRDIARRDCIQRNKPVKAAELTGLIERLLVEARQPMPESEAPPRSPNGDGRQATVFIVDDDRAVREAMRELLEQEGRLVEVYPSAKEFLAAHRPGRTGCLVVDSNMPGMTGIELLESLRAEQHDLPAIMVTAFGDVRLAVRAMQAGAAGFIEKPVRPEELLAAVDGVLARSHDSAALAAWREEMAKRVASLTRSQRRVMDLVLEGNPNKKIAAVLGVSQRTVENHRAAVMKKIRAASLSQLIHLTLAASQHHASSVR